MLKLFLRERLTDFRPVFYIAIYLSFGLLIGYNIGENLKLAIILGGICLGLALFDSIKNKSIPILILYILSFAVGVMLISYETQTESIPVGECEISGRVVDIKHYEYNTYYTLDDWKAENEVKEYSPRKNIRFSTPDRNLEFGDIVKFKGKISIPKEKRNIGGFNERIYLLGKGIGYKSKAKEDDITILGRITKLDSYFYAAKSYAEDTIEKLFSSETQGIAKGLVLGEKGDISEEDYERFKAGGTASILAASGLHFGIISFALFGLLSLLGVGRKTAYILTGVLMFGYAGIVGFTVSAARALIMAWVIIIANILGRRKDYFAFLCTAYIISLLIRPSSIFSVGFQLSFGAVFAIIALSEPLNKLLKWMPSRISGLTSASISASLGTAPIIINSFYYISIIGVVANIIIIPIGSIAVIAVFLSAVLGSTLGIPVAFVADKIILLMKILMKWFTEISFAAVNVKALPAILVALWFITIFIMSGLFLGSKKIKRIISVILIVIMIGIMVFVPMKEKQELEIYFFDVGQGDASFIKTPSGKCYLVDTGREYEYDEIERFLASQGYKLDGLFLTHSDTDHNGGYEELKRDGYVETIYIPKVDLLNYDFGEEERIVELSKGMAVELDDKIVFNVLYPTADLSTDESNELSLCMMLEYGEYRVLFTGDIDKEIETILLPELEDADVLKVSHHGSKNGSTPHFLNKIDAEYAVIMCGENYYGHPSDETLYNLEKYCDIIYRTDIDGGITFTFGKSISVDTVIKDKSGVVLP